MPLSVLRRTKISFTPTACRKNAERFAPEVFRESFARFVNDKYEKFRKALIHIEVIPETLFIRLFWFSGDKIIIRDTILGRWNTEVGLKSYKNLQTRDYF